MARLPRYSGIGVQANIPRSVDYAGFRGEAAAGQAMSAAFDQMSGFLYKTAQQDAMQAGLERVKTEGAQPLLEAIQAQGGPRGLEEETAYKAANQIAVAEIQNEAELEITKILTDGQNNKQSFSSVQAQLQDVTDGFPAALSNVDPVSAAQLRSNLQTVAGKAELRYSKYWSGELLKIQKKKQNIAAANKAELIIGTAAVGNLDVKQLEIDIKRASNELSGLGVRPEDIETWEDSVREKAIKENTLFTFYQKDLEEQDQIIKDIKSGKTTIDGMDYEASVRFVNSLLMPEYNRNKRAFDAQADFIINKAEDMEDLLENGGRISQDDLNELIQSASEIEQFNPEASAKIKTLQETDNFFASLRGQSLAELEATVVQLEDGFDGSRDSEIEQLRYEQASKFLDNARTQIADDPMGYASKLGLINRNQIVEADENGRPQINEDALNQRIKQGTVVQSQFGLATRPLLYANEIREIGLALETAPGAAKLDILGMLSQAGEASGEVLSQLSDYNPNLALVGALVNEKSIQAASLAINGMERLKDGQKPMEFTTDRVDPVFQGVVGAAVTGSQFSQSIKEVGKAIYTELSITRGLDAFDEELYKQALQMAAGQREVNGQLLGGIQPVRDLPTFIMPNQTADKYEMALQSLSVEAIQKATGQTIDPEYPGQILDEEKYKIRHNDEGGDVYYIEYLEDETKIGTGTPVLDTDGNVIYFKIDELYQATRQKPPEVMSEMSNNIIAPALTEEQVFNEIDLSDAQDPGIETRSGEAQRFAFESASSLNKKQTEKLVKELEAGIQSGKLDEAATVDLFNTLPELTDDNFDADLYGQYADFVIDGGKLVYTEWLKTKQ
tara:strand:+ start:3990 stop:6524 length:2535 start_codon:yes stop_codon:yes gene_type:complete